MKKYILFLILIIASFTVNAQNEFTGEGDGFSWEDPFNWLYGESPISGDDILIDGFSVYHEGSFEIYGTLELRGGAYLFTQGDIQLSGDFIVDFPSTFEIYIVDTNVYSKVTCQGNYFFNGTIVIGYAGHVPQIGESYPIIEGAQGSCGTPTTVFVPDNPSNGFEVTLGTLCLANSVTFEVTDINYTTAILWDGEGGDGLWNTAANWDPNGVPPDNSLLIFNLPGAGGYANTNGAGTTEVYNIKIGNNNTLAVNGDLLMTSVLNISEGGTLVWNSGKIHKANPGIQSLIISDGEIILDSPGLKELDDDVEIWVFKGDINHNQGDLDINNGKIRIFNLNNYNINADDIDIGYTSGTTHELDITVPATLRKANGTGTSTINLTDFKNNGDIISDVGTLVINGTLNPGIYSEYGGSGNIQFPDGFIIDGELSPGSSPGILTIIGDLTTAPGADFNIEIDGPTAGADYDQIVVTNTALLEGTLNVTLGYLPANDASFEIVTAGTLTSCNFPAQITSNYNGTDYTFDVICLNNILYLNGPGATLSTSNFDIAELKVYPNPTHKKLTLEFGQSFPELQVTILNILGQVITNERFVNTNTVNVTIDGSPGIYFVNLNTSEGYSKTVKIIKQ